MTRLVAKVTKVLVPGIHTQGFVENGEVQRGTAMKQPTRVVIELAGGPDEECMMYRYTDANEFCGDTWHMTLAGAFSQAAYEYGLTEGDFSEVTTAS
jgi:hypothetical protein